MIIPNIWENHKTIISFAADFPEKRLQGSTTQKIGARNISDHTHIQVKLGKLWIYLILGGDLGFRQACPL